MTNRVLRILPAALAAAFVFGAIAAAPAAATTAHSRSDGFEGSLSAQGADEPVLMLVSLRDQSLRVFSGDRLLARSSVSTGKQGHATPTGVFSVLEKKRRHHSNIYSRAPMPFMQRLTWSGIALHESDSVPAYPASHGCVRLPEDFAKQLYAATELGAHVLITEEALDLQPVVNSALIYPPGFEPSPEAASASTPSVLYLSTGSAAPEPATEALAELGSSFVLRTGLSDDNQPEQAEIAEPAQPLRILITRRTGREMVRDIQSLLNALGHEAGDVDGLVGPDTGKAIVRFQKANDLQPTGTVSVELARLLHEKAGGTGFSTGHIYVRRGFEPVFDAPIELKQPDRPLGTHFLTALPVPAQPDGLRWTGATLADRAKPSPLSELQPAGPSQFRSRTSLAEALTRIGLPEDVRERLSAEIVPGSSLVITDHGISDESHKGTDFVVLTDPG